MKTLKRQKIKQINILTSLCQTSFEQILSFPSSALVRIEKITWQIKTVIQPDTLV